MLAAGTITTTRDWLLDLVALAKPRLSLLVMWSAATGMAVAPGHIVLWRGFIALVTTALVVAAANALNSYMERDIDALMLRTRDRPLAAQRLEPRLALYGAVAVAAIALPALWAAANLLTAALGLLAFVLYVFAYTPLKRISSLSLLVGAIPGAMPPLMGWTAATGRLDLGGLALFAIVFVWQLPHFIAISIYLRDDYARAGLKVFAVVHGARTARLAIVLYTLLLVPVTLVLVPLGVAPVAYGVTAGILGLALWAASLTGLRASADVRWARRFFAGTIAYLTVLLIVLVSVR